MVGPVVLGDLLEDPGAESGEPLDLSRDATVAAIAGHASLWEHVLERLQADEMPPEDAPPRPTADERPSFAVSTT